eukprot:TRINITY_DN2914_c1_g1_i2.p1 TRINITY_DN2914_c1_g1~~TRINITY_DN2914_c1_g1_i2.p1  ORF type:complete len:103 (-),score=23.30 TRINITY_DN2914_c1_g1_i2:65-373(-)
MRWAYRLGWLPHSEPAEMVDHRGISKYSLYILNLAVRLGVVDVLSFFGNAPLSDQVFMELVAGSAPAATSHQPLDDRLAADRSRLLATKNLLCLNATNLKGL